MIFLGVLGVSAVKISSDARKAEASVPRMGVAASDGGFEGEVKVETRGDCQNLSIRVSESVIL